jgi:H+/Cl- antiporter ClcA
MSFIAPSKELLQMIEERIPCGRFLTTTALLLAVLAIIAGACGYLYRAIVLPALGIATTLVKTGTITRADLAKTIAGMISTVLVYSLLEWMHRGSSRLMREILDSHGEVLEHARQTTQCATDALEIAQRLEARIEALENKS